MGDASEELEAELTADEWRGGSLQSVTDCRSLWGPGSAPGGDEQAQGETNRHTGRVQ